MHEARLFTFDTTHHALWAEEIAAERGIPSDLVPAPAAAHARCNLALETVPEGFEKMKTALRESGVPFNLYPSE